MDKFESIRVFLAVAELQSFAQAGQRIGISAPAVTRSIAQLERSLDVRLFFRTTRLVRLTEAGQRFYSDSKRIMEDLEEAEAAANGSYLQPKGLLSVTAPVIFGRQYMVPLVSRYLEENPQISVRLVLLDKVTHLIEEGLDIALRIGHLPESSLYAKHVGNVKRVLCASPQYLAKHGVPETPEDLQHHSIIFSSTTDAAPQWQFGGPTQATIKLSPRFRCNHNIAAIDAAIAGTGITRAMSYQVANAFDEGTLERVLEGYETDSIPVNLVYIERRRASAKVRSFIDFCSQALSDNPHLQS